MQTKIKILPTLAISLLAAAGYASATTIETTSYSTWVASLTGSPTDGFSYVASGSYSTASGWSTGIGTYGTFVVTGPDGASYSLNQTYYGSGSTSSLVGALDGTGGVNVSSVAGVTGIMLGVGENGSASPITVTLSDGETFTINPTVGGTTLIGFSSSTTITSVYLSTAAGSAVVLDDLLAGVSNLPASTGPTSPASECATILLIAGGLVFLGAKRKIFSNVTASHA
jgi:hypothetical protein